MTISRTVSFEHDPEGFVENAITIGQGLSAKQAAWLLARAEKAEAEVLQLKLNACRDEHSALVKEMEGGR